MVLSHTNGSLGYTWRSRMQFKASSRDTESHTPGVMDPGLHMTLPLYEHVD